MADTGPAAGRCVVGGDGGWRELERTAGRALRKAVPRSSHAAWDPGRSAVAAAAAGGVQPAAAARAWSRSATPACARRRSRSCAAPPAVMAHDLATTPVTGITVQACGDAHLLNFGCSPPRSATWSSTSTTSTRRCPAPGSGTSSGWPPASSWPAATIGFGGALRRRGRAAAVRTYREQMAALRARCGSWTSGTRGSTRPRSSPWPRAAPAGAGRARWPSADPPHQPAGAAPADRAGRRRRSRFVDDPPLLTHVDDATSWLGRREVAEPLPRPRSATTARAAGPLRLRRRRPQGGRGRQRRHPLLRRAAARGPRRRPAASCRSSRRSPRCWSRTPAEPLPPPRPTGRQRPAADSRRPATSSSAGPATAAADYYVRQLWDMKGSVDLEHLSTRPTSSPTAALCGWVLARAHARSGDAAAIAGYLGSGDRFDQAIATSPRPTPTRPRPTTRRSRRPGFILRGRG